MTTEIPTLSSPSVSPPLILSGAGFKRIGPQFIQPFVNWRGDLLPDLILPSWSQTITVCNADADTLFVTPSGPTVATGTLTVLTGGTVDNTIVIEGRTYTLKASVTTTADQIKTEATAALLAINIRNAINANGLGGYGTDTTPNVHLWASVSGAVITVTSRTGGIAANSIDTTEVGDSVSWTAATLLGGLDDADVDSGRPVVVANPYTFRYDGDAVPTLFCHCAAANTFTVLFHGV